MALADIAEVLTRDRLPLRELVAGTAMPGDDVGEGEAFDYDDDVETNVTDLAAWIDNANRKIQ